ALAQRQLEAGVVVTDVAPLLRQVRQDLTVLAELEEPRVGGVREPVVRRATRCFQRIEADRCGGQTDVEFRGVGGRAVASASACAACEQQGGRCGDCGENACLASSHGAFTP